MTYTKPFSLAFPTRPEMEQPLPTCKYNTIYVRQITNKYYHQNQVIYIFKVCSISIIMQFSAFLKAGY